MNLKQLTIVGIFGTTLTLFTACGTTQNTQQTSRSRQGQRPTAAQLIAEMDSNNDGKLSKDEVKGPLLNDFSTIDTNDDGFLSKEELENAPRPQGNQRRGQGRRQ